MSVIKFHEWYMKWFELYRNDGLRKTTINKYMRTYKVLCKSEMGQMELAKITREDAQKYVSQYGSTRAKKTVTDHTQTINSCFSDARDDGLIKTNPFARVKLVYTEQKLSFAENKALREEKKWLEIDEYERLRSFLVMWLSAAFDKKPFTFADAHREKSVKAQTNMMIIFIALKTGMRYSELLGLTRDDVNYENNTLLVDKTWDYKLLEGGKFVPTKNYASMREVVVDEETIGMIKKMIKWQDEFGLNMELNTFFCETGMNSFNATVNNLMKVVTASLGIEYISLHKLRHIQASYLLAKGIPLSVVAKRLGHTDTKMIQQTYGHLLKETEDKANKQILALL